MLLAEEEKYALSRRKLCAYPKKKIYVLAEETKKLCAEPEKFFTEEEFVRVASRREIYALSRK